MYINYNISLGSLIDKITKTHFWDLSEAKLLQLLRRYDLEQGSPVLTVRGQYMPRPWTEWTMGFFFGSIILQYEITKNAKLLYYVLTNLDKYMVKYLTHSGIHDHGFQTISSYGNLLRALHEDKEISAMCRLAIKVSGAVQAMRWTSLKQGGYIYSFKGPHSLFIDTMRTLRVLALAFRLGHILLEEGDQKISLLERLVFHALTTARYNVYYGEGRDMYDVRGRVAQEALFNVKNQSFVGVGVHQGYSPFSTWMRGLAWAILGFAEQLEFLSSLDPEEFARFQLDKNDSIEIFTRAATATADFYIANTARDGIPYWDSGTPNLKAISLEEPADPYNPYEPVDSSAAVIAAQGLLRLGHFLKDEKFVCAGLTVANRILDELYLSSDLNHEGLILHSIYNRPYGWDYVPDGHKIPCGEASMWGDYHARELILYITYLAVGKYLTFYSIY